jgi:F0F1-type ATP synthase assembly protein I
MPQGLPDPKEVGSYYALAQVGLEMVAPVVLGLALDYYLDWSPWGVIVGAVLGLVGGLAHLVSITNRREDRGSGTSGRDKR